MGGAGYLLQVYWSGLCESRRQAELVKEKRIDEDAGTTETRLVHGLLSRTSARKGEVRLVELVGGGAVYQGLLSSNGGASICQMVADAFGKSCDGELTLDFGAFRACNLRRSQWSFFLGGVKC